MSDQEISVGSPPCSNRENISVNDLRTPTSILSSENSHRPSRKNSKFDLLEKACTSLLSIPTPDEFDVIASNVACKLRRMDETQKLYAEHLINMVLFYGSQGKLNENCNISLVDMRYSASFHENHLNYSEIAVPNTSENSREEIRSSSPSTNQVITEALSEYMKF